MSFSSKRTNKSSFLFFLPIFCLALSMVLKGAEPVWFWFATCGGPAMTLEVKLDNETIYKSTFPLCRAERGSIEKQGAIGRAEFRFRPPRAITWSGYRGSDEKTKVGQLLEADVWQAGADRDDLLIGVSFSSGSEVYMNTVHIARPDQRDQTIIADGLVITTYPAAESRIPR